MNEKPNVQNALLDAAKRTKTVVTIFLVNGFQMHGLVKSYDNFCILLEADGKQNMVYKHAVSTVTPSRNLDLQTKADGAETGSES